MNKSVSSVAGAVMFEMLELNRLGWTVTMRQAEGKFVYLIWKFIGGVKRGVGGVDESFLSAWEKAKIEFNVWISEFDALEAAKP